MSYPWDLRNLFELARHRAFFSYQHCRNQVYRELLSRPLKATHEAGFDSSPERLIECDKVAQVIRQRRENCMNGTSRTIVLSSIETRTRRYADWEVKADLKKKQGLIGALFPTLPVNQLMKSDAVPSRLSDNIASGYAPLVHWDQPSPTIHALKAYIAEAKSRSASRIRNTRDIRFHNA